MAGNRKQATSDGPRNKGLQESDERLHDPEQRVPRQDVDQDAGAVDAKSIPDNASDRDSARLENPPQVIGPRERNNDAV